MKIPAHERHPLSYNSGAPQVANSSGPPVGFAGKSAPRGPKLVIPCQDKAI